MEMDFDSLEVDGAELDVSDSVIVSADVAIDELTTVCWGDVLIDSGANRSFVDAKFA